MTALSLSSLRSACSLGILATIVGLSATASAQETRVTVETETPYVETTHAVEIEPHFAFGPDNVYGTSGVGAGLRLGVPLAVGHVGHVRDDWSLSFGGDWIHYDDCYFNGHCAANYVMVPVAAQWNVYVVRRVSLFAEAGAFVYKGWFDGCAAGDGPGCNAPSDFGVLPTLAVGGRIYFNDSTSFTMRLGYPTVTLGVSFM